MRRKRFYFISEKNLFFFLFVLELYVLGKYLIQYIISSLCLSYKFRFRCSATFIWQHVKSIDLNRGRFYSLFTSREASVWLIYSDKFLGQARDSFTRILFRNFSRMIFCSLFEINKVKKLIFYLISRNISILIDEELFWD